MNKLKEIIVSTYYDIMSNPLLSIVIRVLFVCLALILLAYFLFYAIIFAVILIPIYYIWKYLNSN
jgi:hypothetical protein